MKLRPFIYIYIWLKKIKYYLNSIVFLNAKLLLINMNHAEIFFDSSSILSLILIRKLSFRKEKYALQVESKFNSIRRLYQKVNFLTMFYFVTLWSTIQAFCIYFLSFLALRLAILQFLSILGFLVFVLMRELRLEKIQYQHKFHFNTISTSLKIKQIYKCLFTKGSQTRIDW